MRFSLPTSEPDRTPTLWWRLGRIAMLAGVYILAARVGLLFATTPDQVSPVWPLSGIVFIVLLRGGLWLWPGVFLGELITGLWLGIPLATELGIAAVTTLEVVLGVVLTRPLIGRTLELDSLWEVTVFVVATALISVPLAAAGAALLFTAREGGDWAYTWQIWRAWWIGDVMGILTIAPTVMALQSLRFRRLGRLQIAEGVALYTALILTTTMVMWGSFNYAYILIIFIIWAALRVGPRGTAVATAIVCSITVWLTALGQGPFVISVRAANLFFLQTFLAVVTVTGLIMSALVAERDRRARAAQLLADIGALLAQRRDELPILREVAERLARWADGCAITLLELDGKLQTVAAASANPAHAQAARALAQEGSSADVPPMLRPVLRDQRAVLLAEGERDVVGQLAADAGQRRAWAAIGPLKAMAAPLLGYAHPLGAIVLFSADRARVYHQADLQSAMEAGERVAQALTAARLAADLVRVQKFEAIGQLAGGIAHDFNNLLTVIVGRCDLALFELARGSAGREEFEAILQTARQAQALVRELQVIGYRGPATAQVVALNDLVRRAGLLLRPLLNAQIELAYELAPDVGRCAVDPSQLERVIVNLVTNARDAMPAGGRITIATGTLALAQPTPELPDLPPGRYCRLSVRDTGGGIDPAILARIFEPYFTTKAPTGGSGLGLAISYGIIRQFGGTIVVHSEVGRGTQFEIYLPESAADEVALG